jgi:hypothetical protein
MIDLSILPRYSIVFKDLFVESGSFSRKDAPYATATCSRHREVFCAAWDRKRCARNYNDIAVTKYNHSLSKMKNKAALARHLGQIAITLLAFLGLNWINELVFAQLDQSVGITWVFIPAGIRLLSTMFFGFAGFEGLLLAGIYLNNFHFAFDSDFRVWSGALAGALGPYLAALLVKHWFVLEPRLKGLTAHRLLFTGVLCGFMSPALHHAFTWILTGKVDWTGLTAMIVGDTTGILIVLSLAKGIISLADRYFPAAHLAHRYTSTDGTETH